jgi:hypothetical protein
LLMAVPELASSAVPSVARIMVRPLLHRNALYPVGVTTPCNIAALVDGRCVAIRTRDPEVCPDAVLPQTPMKRGKEPYRNLALANHLTAIVNAAERTVLSSDSAEIDHHATLPQETVNLSSGR